MGGGRGRGEGAAANHVGKYAHMIGHVISEEEGGVWGHSNEAADVNPPLPPPPQPTANGFKTTLIASLFAGSFGTS